MYNYDLTTPICLTTQTVLYTKYVKFNTVSVNVTVTVVIVSRKRFYFLYFVLPLWRADYAKFFFLTDEVLRIQHKVIFFRIRNVNLKKLHFQAGLGICSFTHHSFAHLLISLKSNE